MRNLWTRYLVGWRAERLKQVDGGFVKRTREDVETNFSRFIENALVSLPLRKGARIQLLERPTFAPRIVEKQTEIQLLAIKSYGIRSIGLELQRVDNGVLGRMYNRQRVLNLA